MNCGETDSRVLIIGYGNVLRGDDGVGWRAARRIEGKLPPGIASVLTVHQLLPELAEQVSRAKLAIFIDADSELGLGEVKHRNLTPTFEAGGTIGHHQDPEKILGMAKELYGHAPEGVLYHVGGENFGYRRTLSRAVQRALPALVQEISDLVLRFSPEAGCCNA